jgi:hypothetical protein
MMPQKATYSPIKPRLSSAANDPAASVLGIEITSTSPSAVSIPACGSEAVVLLLVNGVVSQF